MLKIKVYLILHSLIRHIHFIILNFENLTSDLNSATQKTLLYWFFKKI